MSVRNFDNSNETAEAMLPGEGRDPVVPSVPLGPGLRRGAAEAYAFESYGFLPPRIERRIGTAPKPSSRRIPFIRYRR